VQHLGIAFSPTLATEHLYANFPANHRVVGLRRSLQAITGAAFMLPKALFLDAGGFYEATGTVRKTWSFAPALPGLATLELFRKAG
jgi:hypothetical protein